MHACDRSLKRWSKTIAKALMTDGCELLIGVSSVSAVAKNKEGGKQPSASGKTGKAIPRDGENGENNRETRT